jgi:flagellar biosynthesis protein FlhF
MIYRVYRAPTYKEAVVNAKMELGSDVYIIARKEVKEGGFLGLFRNIMTEITVAKNEENDRKKIQQSTQQEKGPSSTVSNTESNQGNSITPVTGSGSGKGQTNTQGDNAVMNELMEIKRQLKQVLQDHERDNRGEETGSLQVLLEQLRENDFSEDYINKLEQKFETELSLKDVQQQEKLQEKIRIHILDSIDTSGPLEVGKNKPRVVVLVGPTGVGKTTTIAKLAASFGVLQKKKVELLTIDSYRIAAIEQLGKYAELMQLPFAVINSREEFKNAVMNSKAEMILVDTVGRSPKNNLGLAELRDILDGVKSEMDVHLVLSATTKYRDAIDIVIRFNQLMYGKIIITKLDETNTIGPLLSVLNSEKKLSYFTTGQSVPDDIEIACKEKLYDMIAFTNLDVKSAV